jgi:Asp-tRNA(Asn)/Glu-tRNA(Gln) amidotransferase A subunit family amidase
MATTAATTEPCFLSAAEAAAAIAAGTLTSEALTASCLARIDAREPEVHAWAWLDPDAALARARDDQPSRGPLHGIPIGIKDIIDIFDMPTELGCNRLPIGLQFVGRAGSDRAMLATATKLLAEIGMIASIAAPR